MENGITIIVSKGMVFFLAVRVKAKESLIVAIKSCQEERGLTVDVAKGDKAAIFGNHALTHLDIAKPSS